MIRRYATPLAFKQALEQRIKSSSTTGVDFARRRQLLVFERFLARVVSIVGEAVTLKGGLVLEMRLAQARTTKDIDLRMMGSADGVLDRLQTAGRLDLGDYMSFEVRPDFDHPAIRNAGMQYDGYRYRAECRLAGVVYGRPFGVDVAFGDPLVGEPDLVVADDLLNFAGIAPPTLRLYPVVSHIAEKLHALTMPRSRPNTRVRDLPDIALLAMTGPIEGAALRLALDKTFGFRGTHTPCRRLFPLRRRSGEDLTVRWLPAMSLSGGPLRRPREPCQSFSTLCSIQPPVELGNRRIGSGCATRSNESLSTV
ncbi:MAG TPA: nucleotidyl transferase AbiEii/AbiGii toxin family protein [Thermoanaerobaculia bacterium]|jgi:hypothetical protein|nr:nucleotidyl transferase AbiEii/AbiGii toxin family protein [Thermoanaerobaculia bacterium]